jgi:transposase
MSKSLSPDLRNRVLAAIDGGASCRQAASRFNVSARSWPKHSQPRLPVAAR